MATYRCPPLNSPPPKQTNLSIHMLFEELLGYKEKARNFSILKLRQKKRIWLFFNFLFENEVILEG